MRVKCLESEFLFSTVVFQRQCAPGTLGRASHACNRAGELTEASCA